MGGDVVGEIRYDARIDTSKLAIDGAKADQIVKNTGDEVETSGRKSFSNYGLYAKAGLVTAALATGALAYKVAKTGEAYDTLQQTTRAALTTILGSAKAANAQMDKLDEFARTSPFAKDVFIKAQQQLIGFGVEAKRVIPTLNAIQDAVAAAGGSSDDIGAITDVLSRIQSQGKLSGEALERLGYYGIDAAAIIGKQMGLTADQIREMASKPGGIPADQVWDPLVNGLEQKFGGAAAGVKNTWAGTTDRIRAAFRDLSAAIIAPFIDPNGGGYAISWGNQLADTMRSAEAAIKGSSATIGQSLKTIGDVLVTVSNVIRPLTDYIANNAQVWDFLGKLVMVVASIVGGLIVTAFVAATVATAAFFALIQATLWLWSKTADGIIWVGQQISDLIGWFRALPGQVSAALGGAYRSVSGFVGSVLGAIGSLAGSMWSIGRSIVDGLIAGIQNGAGAVVQTVKNIASGALDAIKKFFGIHSPSRVMAQMGDYMMQGFSQGMDRSSSLAINSAQSASAGVLGAFGGGVLSPSISGEYAASIGSQNAVQVVQNNTITSDIDLDKASRQLAYQMARG